MNTKHNAITRLIHWLTALLVITAFTIGPEDIDEMENPNLDWGLQAHETLGLLIFGLTIVRIVWIFFTQKPIDVSMPRTMQIASKAVQGALYLLLLSIPLTAVLGTWLEGDSLSLFGNATIVSPFATNENLGELLLDIHPVLADILIWLAGTHAAAGLFHHYILKDDVLKSMSPR